MSDISQLASRVGGEKGGVGQILPISLHYLAQGEEQEGGLPGGYKEMSSIFAYQYRPRNTSPNAGGGRELRGLSHEYSCALHTRDMEPK